MERLPKVIHMVKGLISRTLKGFAVLSFFYLTCNSTANAESNNILFSKYTVTDGLSQNSIQDIMQDSRGFLWIATKNGLNCFDGYSFQNIKISGPEPKQLSNNIIHCLAEDQNGNIWIGTDYGLNVYLVQTKHIIQYYKTTEGLSFNKILSMCIDKENLLWLGSGNSGVDVFDLSDTTSLERLYHFDTNNNQKKIPGTQINNIYEDLYCNKWLCTENGLIRINSELNEIKVFNKENTPWLSLIDNSIHDIKQWGSDYWIATTVGLYKVDFHNKTSVAFYEGKEPHSLPHNDVRSIDFDHEGNLLIGSLGGYSILDLRTNTIKSYIANENNFRSLSTNFVISVFPDNKKNVWLGTAGGGLYRYNLRQNGFEYYTHCVLNKNSLSVNNINTVLDSPQWLFVGTCGGGLNVLNKQTDKYFYLSSADKSTTVNKIAGNYISALYLDDKGILWTGCWGDGISYIDTKAFPANQFHQLDYQNNTKQSLSGRFISCIASDKKGNKWIGMKEGINLIKEDGTIVDFSSLGIEDVSEILCDSRGAVWITTETGLHILKFQKNKELNITNCTHKIYHSDNSVKGALKGQIITSIEEDSDGNMWLGTYDQGVNKAYVNPVTALPDSFISFSVQDGLCNETIFSIIEDDQKNIWFSTDFGLSKYLPKKGRFINYYESDGLLSNQFSWSARYKSYDNKLFFGSPKGLLAFYPDSIQDYIPIPQIQLTALKIFGEEVNAGDVDSPLKKDINSTDSIELSSYQNSIAFEYVALSLKNPNLFGYKYFLDGVDKNWIEDTNVPEASYNNLRPGHYVFTVLAYEKSHPQNISVKSIFIRIKPAFYQTIWFKLIVSLLVGFVLFLVFNMRYRNLKKLNQKLERKVNERTIEIRRQNEEINLQQELLLERTIEMESSNEQLNNINQDLEEKVLSRTIELQEAKERAEVSDRLKTTFLENLSHEIRTPLNAIVGFSDLTFNLSISEEERKEFHSIVCRSSTTLLNLIDDILEISKLDTGEFKITPKEFYIKNLLVEIKEIYQYEIDMQNDKDKVDLKINISQELEELSLFADPQRISQILHVLLNNAVKYTTRGYIEIGCLLEDEFYVKFYVKDTGIGISPENQSIIFERFRKADDHTDVIYRGAGIGLTIAQKLVSFMGGNIWVDSKENEGSTFYFTVEKRSGKKIITNNVLPKASTKNTNIPDFSGKTILVAEDDEANFFYLNSLLERTKANIIHAKNGNEVLNVFDEGHIINIVLMDIRMPQMNGYDAFNKIRSQNLNVPVIAQTSFGFSDDQKKIMNMGFNDYLSKPIEPKDLYSVLYKYN